MVLQKFNLTLTLTSTILFCLVTFQNSHATPNSRCLKKFANQNGAQDTHFQETTLKPIHHEFSEKVFSYDPEKISDFHISKENFSKFPLFHLLVKPGHILARDYRYMISLKQRLLNNDRTLDLSGKEPIELVVHLDGNDMIQRIELIGGHHRMIAIYGYLKKIGAPLNLASVLALDHKALDIQYTTNELNHMISKVPLHGILLGKYQGKITPYQSGKVPSLKVHVSNYVAGSRTPLGVTAKFSLRQKNHKKRIAFYVLEEDSNMSDDELEVFLEFLNDKAFTHRYREIMILCFNPKIKQKIIDIGLQNHKSLNLYVDNLDSESKYILQTESNHNEIMLELIKLRLQQMYQTYNVWNISGFDL